MGTPKLTLADLLALRDREAPPAGVELALAADATAQLALLEHRLLALAFTMPPPGTPPESPPPQPTDLAILEGYVMGTLAGDKLTAYEDSVRGNPERFAELVDFKNVFFGRSQSAPSPTLREPPAPDREELGVLAVRSIAGQRFLSWRPQDGSSGQVLFLRAAEEVTEYPSSSDTLQSLLEIEGLMRDTQREVNQRIDEIRSKTQMMLKTRALLPLSELRDALSALVSEQDRLADRLRELRERVADALASRTKERLDQEDGGPWSRSHEIETPFARLEFTLYISGSLHLRIAGSAPDTEFTWIRPGVTFAALAADERTRHALGHVRNDEALLLISPAGERSQVVRVRRG